MVRRHSMFVKGWNLVNHRNHDQFLLGVACERSCEGVGDPLLILGVEIRRIRVGSDDFQGCGLERFNNPRDWLVVAFRWRAESLRWLEKFLLLHGCIMRSVPVVSQLLRHVGSSRRPRGVALVSVRYPHSAFCWLFLREPAFLLVFLTVSASPEYSGISGRSGASSFSGSDLGQRVFLRRVARWCPASRCSGCSGCARSLSFSQLYAFFGLFSSTFPQSVNMCNVGRWFPPRPPHLPCSRVCMNLLFFKSGHDARSHGKACVCVLNPFLFFQFRLPLRLS